MVLLLAAVVTAALQERVQEFQTAFQAGDVPRLMKLWSDDAPNRSADRKRLTRLLDNRVEFEATVTDIREDGARGNAALELHARSAPQQLLEKYEIEFQLRKGEWRIERLVSEEAELADRAMKTRAVANDVAPSTPLIRELLHRGGESLNSGDPEHAQIAFTLARELADKAGDRADVAAAERGLGSLAFASGDAAAAERHYAESLRVAESANDARAKAKVLVGLARLDDSRGENARGEERAKEALDLFRSAHDRSGEASALNVLANLRLSTGDYAAAKTLFEQSMEIDRELNDTVGVSIALNDLGIISRRQANYREAIDDFRKALKLSREADDLHGVADALGNLGNVLNVQGNYPDALRAYEESIAVNERLGEMVNLAAALTGVGEMYTTLGNYAQAAKFHSRTYALMKKVGYREGMAIALHNLGEVASAQGDAPSALDYFEQALKIDTASNDRSGMAIDLGDVGQAQARLGQRTAARKTFAKALALADQIGDRETMIAALTNRAELEKKSQDDRAALTDLRHAEALADAIGNRTRSWQVRTETARLFHAMHRLDDARREDEAAIAIIEELRVGIAAPETAAQAFESMVAPYQEMVGILVEQNRIDEAFAYAERAKARVLLDVLRGGRTDITANMTAAERQRENELVSRLTTLNREAAAAPDANARTAVMAKLRDARLAYGEFLDVLYAAHPELAVRRGEAKPIERSDLASLLGDQGADALLEFVVTDDKTYLFTYSAGGLRVHTIAIGREDLGKRVAHFREQLAQRDPSYGTAARSLYDVLLKPAEKEISKAKIVGVVPAGALWELPFQALQPSAGHFVLDDRAVFCTPSLTVLHETMQRASGRSRSDARLVAFGNPVIATETAAHMRSVYRGVSLAPLPDAETEVRTIASLYPKRAAVYVEAAAREETAKREAPAFNVLHFATHGILDDQNALYSRLLFSPPVSPDEDGLLEAREIMQLDLHADLAVLSACETARGRVGEGEGLIGMSWAFFVAGCPTTVASQWSVDSATTADLMIAFHRNLRSSGARTAEALRSAALSVRRNPAYRHPYYWAAFVVIGESQ